MTLTLKDNFDNIVSSFSKISYEIYLVQYPIIFLIQYYKIKGIIGIILTIIITVIVSAIIHFALNIKGKSMINIIRILLLMFICIISIIGLYI